MIAADLVRRGYKIAIPYGEDWDYDLIVCRDEKLERVQCKYTTSNGVFINVQCRSHSLTKGKIKTTKHYTAATIDWLAVYDRTTERCYYIPADELGSAGKWDLRLRLEPTLNNQRRRVRLADSYVDI
jgi:PD-(D/E)XK endonuclease